MWIDSSGLECADRRVQTGNFQGTGTRSFSFSNQSPLPPSDHLECSGDRGGKGLVIQRWQAILVAEIHNDWYCQLKLFGGVLAVL